jgi:hypothetical protein
MPSGSGWLAGYRLRGTALSTPDLPPKTPCFAKLPKLYSVVSSEIKFPLNFRVDVRHHADPFRGTRDAHLLALPGKGRTDGGAGAAFRSKKVANSTEISDRSLNCLTMITQHEQFLFPMENE